MEVHGDEYLLYKVKRKVTRSEHIHIFNFRPKKNAAMDKSPSLFTFGTEPSHTSSTDMSMLPVA